MLSKTEKKNHKTSYQICPIATMLLKRKKNTINCPIHNQMTHNKIQNQLTHQNLLNVNKRIQNYTDAF